MTASGQQLIKAVLSLTSATFFANIQGQIAIAPLSTTNRCVRAETINYFQTPGAKLTITK